MEQKKSLVATQKEMFDRVGNSVKVAVHGGNLDLPPDYSAVNALKSAFLMLQEIETRDKQPVLQACTPVSIQNALYSMVVQGLSPEKKQGYFIPYAKKLTFQRSYFGSMALAKRVEPAIGEIVAEIIYEDDELTYTISNGKKQVATHVQKFTNIDNKKIIGAYCIVLDKEGRPMSTELMTFEKMQQSWRQSKMNPFESDGELKKNSTHSKFTDEMCKRTVINRACKPYINASSDKSILGEVIRQAQDDVIDAQIEYDYQENANQEEISFEDEGQDLKRTDDGATVDNNGEIIEEEKKEEQTRRPSFAT